MSSKLLNCLICPKRPDFSDISHLLTHVSSKGHLSHLHKLQVRSHKEIAAGHQLALYNQWYQEHDMGQLLSERMQQKNGKVVAKRQAQVKQERKATPAPVYSSNNVFENPVIVNRREIKSAKRVFKEEPSDDDSEYTSSPVKSNRNRVSARSARATPKKRPSRAQAPVDSEEISSSAAVDPEIPMTPQVTKLKGVVWPGMDLFDAASIEAQRMRNQKKDSSVLKQMKKTSERIEPCEIIYSSGGTKLKERFIDGNIDSSSPLRGETPVPKSQQPKKRQPLAPVSGNPPRYARANAKMSQAKNVAEVRNRAKPSKLPRTLAPSSSIEDLLQSTPRFPTSADENLDLRLALGNPSEKKSSTSFMVYKDQEGHNMPRLGAQNPFNAPPNHIHSARPQLSFLTAPWLQPQNQYPNHLQYANPYLAYTSDGRAFPQIQQPRPMFIKQESPVGMAYKPGLPPTCPDWTHRGMPNQNISPISTQQSYNFFGGFAGQDDPFSYAKNPLTAALGRVAPHFSTTMGSTSTQTPSPIKKKPLFMDGVLSDAEDSTAYEQALFATSE